jgi:hypothetical protein
MRTALALLLSLLIPLLGASAVQAQAGRFIPFPRVPVVPRAPVPRVPSPGGGHFHPHIPIHAGGKDDDRRDGDNTGGWIILAIIGTLALALGGWFFGRVVGGRLRPGLKTWQPVQPRGPTGGQATTVPPIQDLILQPAEVAPKADQTRRLMGFLAYKDRALDPDDLHSWIATAFMRVQKAWQARDYSSVRSSLLPGILAKHEKLLSEMRNGHEINRIEDLRIERLEFVHLYCPQSVEEQEVTALITFRASVYFVDDRTQVYTRGLRSPTWFQEFWIFRRQEAGWQLLEIEQSHESSRLERPNVVADLTDQQLRNAQSCIAL